MNVEFWKNNYFLLSASYAGRADFGRYVAWRLPQGNSGALPCRRRLRWSLRECTMELPGRIEPLFNVACLRTFDLCRNIETPFCTQYISMCMRLCLWIMIYPCLFLPTWLFVLCQYMHTWTFYIHDIRKSWDQKVTTRDSFIKQHHSLCII